MENARRQWPFFLLLLPLSFAAHSLAAQFGRATISEALWVALMAAVGILLAVFLLQIVVSRKVAMLSATFAGILFLYWSYPYLRLKTWTNGALSLTAILAGAGVLWLAVTWGLTRLSEGGKAKIAQFLNLLFGVLLVVNSVFYILQKRGGKSLVAGKVVTSEVKDPPSVFLLLFDESGSMASLKQRGIPNFGLDSFLSARGFFQASRSRSNYSFTHFSVASALNEEYLSIPSGYKVSVADYNRAYDCIRESSLIKSFQESGYRIHSRSVFRVGNSVSFDLKASVTEGANVLVSGTQWGGVWYPLWQKKTGQDSVLWFNGLARNKLLLETLALDAQERDPLFVYAHFLFPHAPFCFDEDGKLLSYKESLQLTANNAVAGYANNWRMAVADIKRAVQSIQSANPKALILLVGDHGYRNKKLPDNDTAQFQNLCAVYYPDGNYTGWTDSLTLVNAIRLIHNKALGTALPLLPDKTVTLEDELKLDW